MTNHRGGWHGFFAILMTGTVMLLVYVHVYTETYRLSYSIQKKETRLAQLGEDYKIAQFRVSRLRSPQYLNQKLKEKPLQLITPKAAEIIKISLPKPIETPMEPMAPVKYNFLSWVSSMKEAQAKTSK